MIPEMVEASREIFLHNEVLLPPEAPDALSIRRASEYPAEEAITTHADAARALLELMQLDPDGTASAGFINLNPHRFENWEEVEDWITLAQLLSSNYVHAQLSKDVQLVEIEAEHERREEERVAESERPS
jgi:hypothetical protein